MNICKSYTCKNQTTSPNILCDNCIDDIFQIPYSFIDNTFVNNLDVVFELVSTKKLIPTPLRQLHFVKPNIQMSMFDIEGF